MLSEKKEAETARLAERIEKRLPAMLGEFVYAASGQAPFPGFQPPPSWAIKALQRLLPGPLGSLLERLNDPNQVAAALAAISGALEGAVAFMQNPTGAVKEATEASPAVGKLCKQVADFMGKHSTAIDRAKGQAEARGASERPTLEQLNALTAACSQGLACAQDLTDEITYGRTLTAEICALIWICWPEVQILETVRELKDWLASMTPSQFSEKLVEKICREIGFPPKPGQKACQSPPTNS